MSDDDELTEWRDLGTRILPVVEAALHAAPESGDGVNDLLEIQHALADLLRSPANNQPELENIHDVN